MMNVIGLDICLMPIRLQRIVSRATKFIDTRIPQLVSVGHESFCERISKHNDVSNIPRPRKNVRHPADDTYESN